MNTNGHRMDIRPPRNAEEWLACEQFLARTEGSLGPLRRDRPTFMVLRGDAIAAVFTFEQAPVLRMAFDREAPAMQTNRAFDLIRAAMQIGGHAPLVFVDRSSPLRPFADDAMERVAENGDVFRLR